MFRKLTDGLTRSAAQTAARCGRFCCPSCGTPKSTAPTDTQAPVQCEVCACSASLSEWLTRSNQNAASPPATSAPASPPPGTRITRRRLPDGTTEWNIPATGKGGFLLVFGTIWTGFITVFTALMVHAQLNGTLRQGHRVVQKFEPGELIILVFWAVGFGLLYAALRAKYATHCISINPTEARLTRRMFGRSSTKSLPRNEIREISRKEFYQQNYTPVYGIEIRAKRGKLRFGSMLDEEEKNWLVAEFQRAVFGGIPATPDHSPELAAASIHATGDSSRFSIDVPGNNAILFVGGFLLLVSGFGIAFSFPEVRGLLRLRHQNAFELFFHGIDSIFFLAALLAAAIALTCIVIGIRKLGVVTRIEGGPVQIAIRKYRRNNVIAEEIHPTSSFREIRTYATGNSNGKPMKAVEIVFDRKTVKLRQWIDGGQADAIAANLRSFLAPKS